jgi:hypothetical protein
MADQVSNRKGKAQEETAVADEQTTEGEATEATSETKKAESKKTPVPDNHLAPVEYAKHLGEVKGEEVKPQIVYGYIRNMKGFPHVEREGFPRFIIPVAEADAFLNTKAEEKAKRQADKAAKEQADREKAAAAEQAKTEAPAAEANA